MRKYNSTYNIQYPALILLIAVLIVGCFSAPALATGGDLVWEYGITPQTGKQEAKSMTVDSLGNAIITGFSDQSGTDDYYVTKIKADGSGVMWSAIYDPAGGNDYATELVIDSLNNVIVTGYVWNDTNYDFHTVKYAAADGAVLWQHSYNADMNGDDYNTSIAVDSLNNIYIGGNTQAGSGKDDIIVLKYSPTGPNPDGTPIWKTIYNGTANGHDRITSITAGIDGLAICGLSENSTPDFDAITIKLGYDGSIIWEKRKSASGYDRAEAVRMDTSGNVIMTGTLYNGLNKDIYTVKYASSNGVVLWEKTYNGGYNDEPEDLFIDTVGDVYITGYTFAPATSDDIFTAKYNGSTGVQEWSEVFNSADGNNDTAKSIVVDPSGDLFVAGDSYDVLEDHYNFQTIKYSKGSGNLLWQKTFDSAVSKNDRVAGVGLSPTGEPVVAGYSDVWTSGASDYDFYIVKYDPGLLNPPTGLSATAISTTQIDLSWSDNSSNEDGFRIERKIGDFGTYSEIDTVGIDTTTYNDTGLAVDTKYFYRVRSYNAGGNSYFSNEVYAVTTIVSFGTPSTVYTFAGADGGDDKITAMATGPDYSPVVTGYSYSLAGQFDYYTLKLDRSDLALIWNSRYDSDQNDMDMAVSILADDNNDVLVSGTSNMFSVQSGFNTNDIYTIKYPSTGPPEEWNDQYNGPAGDDDRSSIVDVSTDGSNNYVVVGYGRNADWNDDIYVVKYLSDGTREWAATPYDGGVMGHDYPSGVVFDASGDIIVSGYTFNGLDYDFFTRKYSGIDGAVLWTDVYDIAGTGNDYARSIAIDTSGNAYVTGSAVTATGNDDFYTIKYDGTNGTRLWEKSFNGIADGVDEALAVIIDPVNFDVLVAGSTLVGTDNNDVHLIRYDAAGNIVWERTLDRPDENDFMVAMDTDPSGNVHIAADTDDGSQVDIMSVQYDSYGSFLGGMIYNGIAGGNDGAAAVTANNYGEAFIGGYEVSSGNDTDYVVYKVTNNLLQSPSPFVVTPIYEDSVLNWTDNSVDEDGFHIERITGSCSSGNPWVSLYTAAPNETSYTNTNLSIGADYCYRIRTYKNNGETSKWVERGITTYYPSAPSALIATVINTTQIDLSWTDTTTGEEGFILEKCEGVDCTAFTELATLNPDVTSYSDPLPCNTMSYSYRIKAFKTGRWNTGYSNTATAVTLSPITPTGVTTTWISEDQININWPDTSDDETGYEIQRCTGNAASCTQDADFTFSYQTALPYNASPIMLLHMDELAWDGTADEVVDVTGAENHGRANSNADTIEQGKFDRAGSFYGSNEYVDVGSVDLGSSWTIDVWFATPLASTADWNTLTRGSSADHQIIVQRSSMLLGTYDNGNSAFNSSGFDMGTLTTGWHHMAAVGSSGTTKFYIDGSYVGTAQYQSTSDIRSIGNHWGGAQQFGSLDEFALFNRALSDVEVLDHYNNRINVLLQYNDTSVTYSTLYTYRIRAYKNTTCGWDGGFSVSISDTAAIVAPDSLNATPFDTTTINLSWNDNTVTEDGFSIERCLGGTCSNFAEIGTTSANINSYADNSACRNTTYNYRVKAFRTSEWDSGYSNEASTATADTIDPLSLTASTFSESQLDLVWTDSMDDEEGYEIQRCAGDAASCTQDIHFTYSTNYTTTPSGTVLYYKMDEASWNSIPGEVLDDSGAGMHGRSYDGANTISGGKKDRAGSFDGSNDYVKTPLNIDQSGSTGYTFEAWVYPTSTSSGRHQVISSDNGGYDWSLLRYGGTWYVFTGSNSWSTGLSVTLNTWQHIVAVFEPGVGTKFYKNGGTPSSTSDIAYDTSDNNINIGRNPGGSEYFAGSIDEAIIYNRALTQVEIQIRYDLSSTGIMAYSDTGLNAGTTYTYRVRAFKNSNCSWLTAFTNTSDATTTLPPPPTDLTADVINTTRIDLAWTDNTDSETLFRIQRCTDAGCDFSTVDEFTVVTDTDTYTDSSVCENNVYRYRVRAEKDTVPTYETAWTAPTIDLTTPVSVTPSDFTATTITESQIDLTWTDNTDDETGFKIERCVGNSCNNFSLYTTVLDTTQGNVLMYRMNELLWDGTSGEVLDDSGSGNHGTASNGANTTVDGKKGMGGSFNGGSTYVSAADSPSLDITSAITMEAWVKLDSYPTEWSLILMKGDTSNTRAFGMWVRNTGDILVSYRSGSTWYQLYPTGQGFTLGSWHHVAGIIDTVNDYRAIYIDGVLKASDTAAIPAMTANNYGLFIGSNGGTWPTNGTFDEVAVFNRAISETEVLAHYNVGLSNTEYLDTGLDVGETYRYRMYAYKDASCPWLTGYSPEVESITTPPAPGSFKALAVATTQVDLSWIDNNASEDGFRIERCTGVDCDVFSQIAVTGMNAASYSDTTVCENVTYNYRAKGYKGVEWETGYSDVKEVTTLPMVAPTGLIATWVSEVQIDLTWDDNTPGESGFKLERCSGDSCVDFAPLVTLGPDENSYSDSGISPETSYSYRVNAFKIADCPWTSAYSGIASELTSIAEPDGLAATAINTTDVDLVWTDNTASETGFSIERCLGSGCSNFAEIATISSGVTSYTDTSVCNSTLYAYRVRGRKYDELSNSGGGCWTRMVPLTITDFESYYQTSLTITHDPDMKSDFSDIRFYDATTGSERPYWIESKIDGTSATVYFKTFGVNDLYMYYGNTNAASVANGRSTFDLYDPANAALVSGFTKSGSNPIFNPGAVNSWDDAHVYGTTVIEDAGIYKMWYSGSDGVYLRIGYATSPDGTNWTRHASNPVIDLGVNGTWDDYNVAYPRVIKDNGVYKMWYAGYDGSNWRIGYATSADGINWSKHASNPIINLGSGGTWDDAHLLAGSVIKENENTYKMWYSGHDGSRYRIGYATSSDGINWIKYGSSAVLNIGANTTWDDYHVYLPVVTKEENGAYHMWYTGHDGANTRIGYASSNNGTGWTKYASNPVINLGADSTWDMVHTYSPFVLRNSDGVYEMWYSGYSGSNWKLGYASVRPVKYAAIAPAVTLETEENSSCYSYDSWDTGYSVEAQATTMGLASPTGLLTVAAGDTQSDLTWTDNSLDETGFSIERCLGDLCSNYSEINTVGPDAESYSDNTMIPATTYCYRVKAYKSATCGWDTAYTNESCDLSYIARPTGLTANAPDSLTIELAWTDNSTSIDEDGFELEKQIFNGTFIKIATLAPDTTAYTDDMGIEAGKEYRYRIRAFKGTDNSPYSDEAWVITPAWQDGDGMCVE